MAEKISRVDYFYVAVRDEPGSAYRLLSRLAQAGVDLLVFAAIPIGPQYTQLVIFPEESGLLIEVAGQIDLELTGPDRAFLIQGDDELGALARIHGALADADVNVYASNGVTDGQGGFGYVVYVKAEDFEKAASALGV